MLHGGLSDVEQQELVDGFKLQTSPIRLLVTGDVASEGVNLHAQCHHLIHYDSVEPHPHRTAQRPHRPLRAEAPTGDLVADPGTVRPRVLG
jgi:hypothetical protein